MTTNPPNAPARLKPSPALVEALNTLYPDGGWAAIQALFPELHRNQICKMASKRGIKLSQAGKAEANRRIQSKLAGVTPAQHRAGYIPWGPREEAYIRTHAEHDTDEQIAAYLGRTRSAVRCKRLEMQIKHEPGRTAIAAARTSKVRRYADWTRPEEPGTPAAARPTRFASVFHLAQGIHA